MVLSCVFIELTCNLVVCVRVCVCVCVRVRAHAHALNCSVMSNFL